MKYVKRPVEVEAFQYDGDLKDRNGNWYVPDWAVKAFEQGDLFYDHVDFQSEPELFLKTSEGIKQVYLGDYIIRGQNGKLYKTIIDISKKI